MNQTEKLIELVRPHQCLYNTKDKDYKNSLKKEILWEKISKSINQSRDETKSKWKNLKDSYTKYKKAVKGTTGQERKYINWPWAPYLSFLDSTIERRPTTSNILIPTETQEDLSLNPLESPDTPLQRHEASTPPETPPPLSKTPDMRFFDDPPVGIPSVQKRKLPPQPDDMDKVLDYLRNKKKPDSIDLLFQSYAESFKKLSPRTQAKTKLKLAKVFTEAELKDLDSENNIEVFSVYTDMCDEDNTSNPALDDSAEIFAEDLSRIAEN